MTSLEPRANPIFKYRHAILGALILLTGAVLRLYDLGAESYWLDEVIMVEAARAPVDSVLTPTQNGRPPLYILLAHVWVAWLGESEAATRSLSALAGIVALAVMYRVGRRLFDPGVALIGMLLMAVSEFQIFHSQNFRYYALFVLTTLVCYLFFLRYLESSRWRDLFGYLLAAVAMFYAHTFGIFVLVAQNLNFVLQWRRPLKMKVQWVLAQLMVLGAILPALVPATQHSLAGSAGVMNWIPEPAWWIPARTLAAFLFPTFYFPGWRVVGINLIVALIFFFGANLAVAVHHGRQKFFSALESLPRSLFNPGGATFGVVGLWLLCPLLIPFGLSKIISPMYWDRYVIPAAPALYLLLAHIVVASRKVVPQTLSLGVLAILIVPGLYGYYHSDVKEQWRAAAALVQTHARANDGLILGGGAGRPFRYYYRGTLRPCRLGLQPTQRPQFDIALNDCVSGCKRTWVILRYNPRHRQPVHAFFESPAPGGMLPLTVKHFKGVVVYLLLVEQRFP